MKTKRLPIFRKASLRPQKIFSDTSVFRTLLKTISKLFHLIIISASWRKCCKDVKDFILKRNPSRKVWKQSQMAGVIYLNSGQLIKYWSVGHLKITMKMRGRFTYLPISATSFSIRWSYGSLKIHIFQLHYLLWCPFSDFTTLPNTNQSWILKGIRIKT